MANNLKKYVSDSTLSSLVAKIKELFVKKTDLETSLSNKADKSHTHSIGNVTNLQSTLDSKVPTSRTINSKPLSANITLSASDVGAAPSTHSHDDRYYTESEVDSKLSSKSDKTHNHDSAYSAKDHNHDGIYALEGHNHDAKYDSKGSASSAVSTHNTSTTAHNDIRDLITGLTNRLNTLANSDDTTLDQMSEIVAYIKNNKSLIDSVTTNKVNVADIVNNLTTNVTNKPLSAAQGVAIKTLIDALDSALDTHDANTTKHITSTERTNWNTAKTHADSAHAPSNAEKNQNAFSNIAVSGQTTVAADTTTDTVTFAGSNVSITTDSTNDKVTFSVADASTSAKGIVQLTNSTSSTSTTTAATPNSVKSAYDLANTAKTRADNAYSLAEGKVDSLSDLGITATATELNHTDGVTSNIQSQLDGKLSTSGGTISGVITTTDGDAFNRNVTTSGTYYYGGTNFDDGAFIGLYGKDQSNYAGQFRLKADNGSSFVYLEGRPDGQLRWNNKNIVTVDSNGAVAIADGGTGARSSSGALANLGGVPLAGGTMTGALKVPQLAATSTSAYIGSMTTPFQQVYTKSVYVQDGVNETISYGDFRAQTTGTASVVGKTQLNVGNSTASGKAGNSRGIVRVYGTKAYYHQIQGDASTNRTLTLPDKNGTLATTADLASLASVATVTTAEYTALEQAQATNANTLYMLTDAEEEVIPQVQFITWEEND